MKKYIICFLITFVTITSILGGAYLRHSLLLNDDAAIEYKASKETVSPEIFGGFKKIYWRIEPSQLAWWQKPFNRWDEVYYTVSWKKRGIYGDIIDAGKSYGFDSGRFTKLKESCKTVGDIKKYLQKENDKFEKDNLERRIKNREKEWKKNSDNHWAKVLNNNL